MSRWELPSLVLLGAVVYALVMDARAAVVVAAVAVPVVPPAP